MKRFILALFTTVLIASSAAVAQTPNPYSRANNTWISIDGSVDAVSADSFVLDYGPGLITVEMDDGDRDADAYKLIKGDKVRVSGMIDDDFFEMTTIEASSVYVENLGTYFFASAVDEEDVFVTYSVPVTISSTVVQGTVTKVDDEEFTLNTGLRSIRVEVEEMSYNPLDDVGYQKIRVGDRVSVSGDMDLDFFELQRELVAKSIVTLSKKKE